MQVETLEQLRDAYEIHIISCFGANQFQLNAFRESLCYDNTTWLPSFINTYIRLDKFTESHKSRSKRLLLSLLSLLRADLRIILFKISKNNFFIKHFSLLRNQQYDAIIFNGRNYRDFDGFLKNYINNRPLTINQELIHILFPTVKKLNSGYSIWKFDSYTEKLVKRLWNKNDLNVPRESASLTESIKNGIINTRPEKDLSFSYLARRNKNLSTNRSKKVCINLTPIHNPTKYINLLNEIINHYSKLDFEIVIIDQVYLEHESTDDICKQLHGPHKRFKTTSLEKLIAEYNTAQFTISTRMHGSIISLSLGVPTASIAYDIGSKWKIIVDELKDYPLFKLEQLSFNNLIEYVESNAAIDHAKTFKEIISNEQKEYVKEFVHNIIT